jgi:Ca2+/Na+ antiporter
MQERGKPSRAVRFLGVVTAFYLVGVLAGVLATLNLTRLAQIHLDREVPLSDWAKLQIKVGHFFLWNGWFVFVVSTLVLAALWLRFLFKSFFSRAAFDEGHD